MARARLLTALVLAAAATALAEDAAKPGAKNPGAAPGVKPASPAAHAPATPRTLDEAMRLLGARRVDVDFRELPLDEAVAFVSKIARVNTMLSPVLQKELAGGMPPVTLRLRDVSLRQFADLLAQQAGAKWVLRDGVLQLTTPKDARGKPVLRVFSIADLTFRIRNFPGPDIRLHVGGDTQYVQEEESDQPHPYDDPQAVVDMLKKFTGKDTWEDDDVSISADASKLVVKQYPEVLKEISRFLAVLRATK